MLPILLIIVGLVLIYIYLKDKASSRVPAEGTVPESGTSQTSTLRKELHRSIRDRKLFGVCSGIAEYFDIDPTIVRILFVFIVLASLGWGLLLYIILAILMPEEKPSVTSV
ncbi:MAG: PspC domain-containing protein [Ignavibacteriae bacterium]|nr:PspC domain-containing protein [Ignavibacteriota bacterium]